MRNVHQDVLHQLHISDSEIDKRKALLGFTREDEILIRACMPFVRLEVDSIVDEFYSRQIQIEEIAKRIGDADTLARLKTTLRKYILTLFEGDYGLVYVKSRLRIGLVHKQVGLTPKHYLSGVTRFSELIESCLYENIGNIATYLNTKKSLQKLISFDTQLIFDTYVHNVMAELESTRNKLENYVHSLEEKVSERTKELSDQARKDYLTNLYNRRSFLEFLKRDLAIANRQSSALCLVFFDVDHFKEINDAYGHLEGDKILQKIGKVLFQVCRESDVPSRFGGDEFCVILPNTTESQAEELCKRIKKKLYNHEPQIEISIGIVQTGPDKIDSIETLLNWADELMYRSKRVVQK